MSAGMVVARNNNHGSVICGLCVILRVELYVALYSLRNTFVGHCAPDASMVASSDSMHFVWRYRKRSRYIVKRRGLWPSVADF